VKAGTSTREKNRTAEAARFAKPSIRLLAVKHNRRFHSDLSQLPDRMPQIRLARNSPTIPVPTVPEGFHGCARQHP